MAHYRRWYKSNIHHDHLVEVVARFGHHYVIRALDVPIPLPDFKAAGEFLLPGKTTRVHELTISFIKDKQ